MSSAMPITKDSNANESVNRTSVSGGLKSFPYPACWEDEERMQVLLAPFRERSVNPENYDSKLKFWQDMIREYCLYKGTATFCKRELQLMFARKQRIPYGLDTVLEDMLRNKKIRSRTEYEYDPENGWTGWAINSFVKKPISWGFGKIKYTIGLNQNSQQQQAAFEYVHVDIVKNFCKDLQRKVLTKNQGKLLHYDTLKEIVAPLMTLTEDCLKMCLHTLQCQRKIGVEYKWEDSEQQIHFIKIPSSVDSNIGITEADRAAHNLQMTQSNLMQQLNDIEAEIKLNDQKVRQYLSENKRQLAKTYLRKKHLLEKNHAKRSLALHNIETLMCNMDEAQSNGEIIDAYKIGSKALQNVLNESGLKYDNVDEIISDVKDAIDTHQEIEDTMGNMIFENSKLDTTSYDNDDLERELKEIMGDSANKSNANISLPSSGANINKINNNTDKKQQEVATNAHSTTTATANTVKTPTKHVVTEEELLTLLRDLDVENNSPTPSNKMQNAAVLQ